MGDEKIEELKKDLYRYRTLYEIGLEENKLLKEQVQKIQQELQLQIQQSQAQSQEQPKRSIVYRGLRKIYRMVVKR